MSEISLYDPKGEPVAYIAEDDDQTVYSWAGEPLAYLDGEHIYGFNGHHLGWFQSGIIWNHQGLQAGFTVSTLPTYPQYESYKGYKSYKPYKSYRQYAPYQPYKQLAVAGLPLIRLLRSGRQ